MVYSGSGGAGLEATSRPAKSLIGGSASFIRCCGIFPWSKLDGVQGCCEWGGMESGGMGCGVGDGMWGGGQSP